MYTIYIFVAICLTGFALLQAIVGVISYNRMRNSKFLLISLAFIVFVFKGIYSLLAISGIYEIFPAPHINILIWDLLIVTLLYLAILKE